MIINNGVYTNNSLTLVDFDLGQIYNSQKFTETSKLFAVLPIGVWLLDFLDITVNGKSIESTQPFIEIARQFQFISEMSVNELALHSDTL